MEKTCIPTNHSQCWDSVAGCGPALKQHWLNVVKVNITRCLETDLSRDVDPMLFYCWSTVYDAGPTLKQHCTFHFTEIRVITFSSIDKIGAPGVGSENCTERTEYRDLVSDNKMSNDSVTL